MTATLPLPRRILWCLISLVCIPLSSGCYAPLKSHGIPAAALPDYFRTPMRTAGPELNFANLTVRSPGDYLLGPNDILAVTVPGLNPNVDILPMQAQVMGSGDLYLPVVGAVHVEGMNLLGAHEAITHAYADGFLVNPKVSLTLAQKSSVSVLVLGKVRNPGVHILPKYENDVGHALAAAGGLLEDAEDAIEVHRRLAIQPVPGPGVRQPSSSLVEHLPSPLRALERFEMDRSDPKKVLRIPLRGLPPKSLTAEDVMLFAGDVVVVPSRRNAVFFVVGLLSTTNTVRFTIGDRERELGVGFVLPRDREIDVVTAVVMAGYIDPIDSPTTVTVQRTMADGKRLLIHVDLIAARKNTRATVLVWPGDIIYLNPDAPWWMRRTFDRIVPDLLTIPYGQWMRKLFNPAL